MNGRRDDDRRRWSEEDELRRGEPVEYQARRRGEYGRDWDEHGYERGPERRTWSGRDERGSDENLRGNEGREVPDYGRGDDRNLGRVEWGDDRDYRYQTRNFDRDRDGRVFEGDRDRRDYERDRDYARAARDLDRAREPGRDFDRDRELDLRNRELDPERIARRPGFSPSGSFRAFQDELRQERERPRRYGDRTRPTSLDVDTDRWGSGQYGLGAGGTGERDFQRYGGDVGRSGPERGRYGFGTRGPGAPEERGRRHDHGGRGVPISERGLREDTERIAEDDTRYGGTATGGHGPGRENMAPPRVGYGTSPSRRDDHELGHGGYMGGTYRSAAPGRPGTERTGRGPRSYQRGDDRIRADLCDRLMQGWMDAEDVDVGVKDGVVTLSGTVRGRDEKRAIEDLAEEVLGVREVVNNIRINRAEGALRHQASQEPVQRPGADTGDTRGLHS